jgi:hypothetical protein
MWYGIDHDLADILSYSWHIIILSDEMSYFTGQTKTNNHTKKGIICYSI